MASLMPIASIFPGTLVPGTDGKCWRAERLVGTGTCCTVWRVQLDGRPDLQAAMKVYKSGNAYTAACEREIMLLDIVRKAKGNSLFLVEVLDSFRYKGHACVVETCLEASLRNIITKNLQQPLSMALVKTLLRQLLSGLLILHDVGFVHGDLKPSNLLWNPQEAVLTIIDFGLSFHVQDKKIGQVQTPNYRAPEGHIWNVYQREQEALPHSEITLNHATTGSLTHQTPGHPIVNPLAQTLVNLLPNPLYHSIPGPTFTPPALQELVPVPLPPTMPSISSAPAGNALAGNGNTSQIPAFLVSGGPAGVIGGGPELTASPENCDSVVNNSVYSIRSHPAPVHIQKPGPPADVWSVAVIIMDMVVGGRFIPSKNQIPTAEIRAGVREAFLQRRDESYDGAERKDWMLLLDMCQRIFFDEPESRLTIEQMMNHDFFDNKINLSHRDLWLLPSCVLRLENMFEDRAYTSEEEQEIMDDILQECVRHGPVVSITLSKHPGKKVYVEFVSWTSSVSAWEGIGKLTFEGRKLLVSFFLNEDFIMGNHY